jgi:hypothetical protein
LVGLANNLVILVFGRFNISTILFLVMKIETPYTIDSITCKLKHLMAYKNSFTNNQIKFNWTLKKIKNDHMLSPFNVFSDDPSLEFVHLQKNDPSFTKKGHYHFFSLFLFMIYFWCRLATTQI